MLDEDSWHPSTLLAFFDVTPCHHVMTDSFFRVQRSSSEFVIFSLVLPHFEFAMQTDDMKVADHAMQWNYLWAGDLQVIDNTQRNTNFTFAGWGLGVQDECRVHYGNKKHLGPNWIASGTTFPDVKWIDGCIFEPWEHVAHLGWNGAFEARRRIFHDITPAAKFGLSISKASFNNGSFTEGTWQPAKWDSGPWVASAHSVIQGKPCTKKKIANSVLWAGTGRWSATFY